MEASARTPVTAEVGHREAQHGAGLHTSATPTAAYDTSDPETGGYPSTAEQAGVYKEQSFAALYILATRFQNTHYACSCCTFLKQQQSLSGSAGFLSIC